MSAPQVTRRQIRRAAQAWAAAARGRTATDAAAVQTTVHPRARFVPRCQGVDALAARTGVRP